MSIPTLHEMLREMVGQPSISSALPALDTGNAQVSETLAAWCADLGFATQIHAVPGKKDRRNLVATAGAGPGGLLLGGHTDTVPFESGRWSSDPFRLTEQDGRLYGLGTSDMKGFFAVALAAVAQFDLKKLQAPLTIVATADEETDMAGARHLTRLPGAQAVLGEPTGGHPVRMHKGNAMQRIRLVGKSGHSSDPANGNSALDGMHAVISDLMALRDDLARRYRHPGFSVPTPTLNLGCIHGGDNPNRICGSCELGFDFRILPGMDGAAGVEEVRRRIERTARSRGLAVEFEAILDVVPPLETPADAPVVVAAERITGLASGSVAFTTEAAFYRQQGFDVVVLGPGDISCAHQPDEYIRASALRPAVDTLAGLIGTFCLQP